MSGWRIVPAVVTDERAATAVMVAHEAGYPMIAVSVAREVIKADIAAAPEPDWQSITDAVIADYCDQGCVAPRHDALMRALKATFGSKP